MNYKFLNEGFTSKSYLINNEYIYLKGKNELAYNSYLNSYHSIMFLKDKIKSTRLPSNIKLIKRSIFNLYGGLLYKKIDGDIFSLNNLISYDLDNICFSISNFLNQVHSIKYDGDYNIIINLEKNKIIENISLIKKYLNKDYLDKLELFKEKYFYYLNNNHELCFTHGDFWYQNYIILDNKLHGVIDFSDSCYFYKESDLAPLLYINKEFLLKVLKSYNYNTKLETIYLFFIRRELVSFKYISTYFKEDTKEQIEKIINTLDFINNN